MGAPRLTTAGRWLPVLELGRVGWSSDAEPVYGSPLLVAHGSQRVTLDDLVGIRHACGH